MFWIPQITRCRIYGVCGMCPYTTGAPDVIYFIEAVGAGLVKIGFTERDVQDRLRELQTASPHRLKLVASISGDINDESALHKSFAHLRQVGEWFRIDAELQTLMWIAKWIVWRIDSIADR